MPDLESMTKAQLEEEADKRGVSISTGMTKAEILDALQAAGDEEPSAPEGFVCVNCGEPATQVTTNPAVEKAYYCDRHATMSHEPCTYIGREA